MREKPSGRRWTRIFRPDARTEFEEELAFHLAERERDYIERGMDAVAARAAAAERLGKLDDVREECVGLLTAERRSEARRDWMRVSALDFKLGLRMLAKYPALTVIGGIAMAFAIAIGAAGFEFLNQLVFPSMGLEAGDRIVAIRNWDIEQNYPNDRVLHDFEAWREQLKLVEHLGAHRTLQRNLTIDGTGGDPVAVAEITASAFTIVPTPPLMGRTLVAADQEPGAPAVLVLGYDAWQRRFDADPDVIGRTVRLGDTPVTVIGVMPEGFGFPMSHQYWTPLRLRVSDYAPGAGPALGVFGRLRRGASMEQAQSEILAVGLRRASEFPDSHEFLRPRMMAYPDAILEIDINNFLRAGLYSSNLLFILFLVLICANVALLMFARAAARESEIVMRSALGASRGRIVMQLFAEALVLGAVSFVIGIAAAGFALRLAYSVLGWSGAQIPFWWRDNLSPSSIAYAAGLTLFAAVIAGVMPGRKITRGLGQQIRQFGAGGGGPQFGGIWTAAIVGQMAMTIIFVAFGIYAVIRGSQIGTADMGFAAQDFLSVRLQTDPDAAKSYRELERRIEAESGVGAVTFAARLPGTYHVRIQTELDHAVDSVRIHYLQHAHVDTDFFNALDVPVLSGRGFRPGDVPHRGAVIVNEAFVRDVLAGQNAVGRRIRIAATSEDSDVPGEWQEIVGVVKQIGLTNDPELPTQAGIYHPLQVDSLAQLHMIIRAHGEPAALAPQLRAAAQAVDPNLRLFDIEPLDRVPRREVPFYMFWIRVLVGVSLLGLILALASIYAVMSFTVARRTREIAIRVALGASRRPLIASILAGPLKQAATGVLVGVGILTILLGGFKTWKLAGFITLFTLVMFGIVMLAAIVPIRRVLRVEPTDALRAEV